VAHGKLLALIRGKHISQITLECSNTPELEKYCVGYRGLEGRNYSYSELSRISFVAVAKCSRSFGKQLRLAQRPTKCNLIVNLLARFGRWWPRARSSADFCNSHLFYVIRLFPETSGKAVAHYYKQNSVYLRPYISPATLAYGPDAPLVICASGTTAAVGARALERNVELALRERALPGGVGRGRRHKLKGAGRHAQVGIEAGEP
jgi:hypothetical protein